MNEIQITKRQDNYISKYKKAVASCEKTMWGLAKVVYETVNNEDFKEVFGNYENYAKAVGVSKGSITKLAKAYNRKLLLEQAEKPSEYTTSQLEEFSRVDVEETVDFVEEMNVEPTDTVLTIRAKVKEYLKEESTEDSTEDSTEETTENCNMMITYKGTEYLIINEEVIEKIMAILESE